MSNVNIPKQIQQKIVRLYNQDLTCLAIARRCKISVPTVIKWINILLPNASTSIERVIALRMKKYRNSFYDNFEKAEKGKAYLNFQEQALILGIHKQTLTFWLNKCKSFGIIKKDDYEKFVKKYSAKRLYR
jgi:DNA invertase Pin-like site-specific DNA recombinase